MTTTECVVVYTINTETELIYMQFAAYDFFENYHF